jgi:hypothetical protein
MAILTQLSSCAGRHRQKRTRTWRTALAWLVAAAVGPGVLAQTAPAREYQVKAVFLFNFAQFVHWPPQAFPEAQAPLVIGVLGDDPFGSSLDDAVRGELVNNHPLVIQRYRRVEDVGE